MRRHKLRCLVVLLSCSVLSPAAAIAGREISKHGVSLGLAVKVQPGRTAAEGADVHVRIDYDFSSPSQREQALAKEVRFRLAPGMRLDPSAAGECSDAAIVHDNGVSGCAKSSIVGTGTIVVDARPAVPDLLDGKVELYNVEKRSERYVLFWFTVESKGKPVSVGELYRITATGDQTMLDYREAPPEQGATALYTPRTIEFTIHGSDRHKPYISLPAKCDGSWPFSLLISAYGGAPRLLATAKARCP